MDKKKCSKCKKRKSLDEFCYRSRSKDERQPHCKECSRKAMREHYGKRKKYYVDKARERNRRIRDDLKSRVMDYLRSHPCVDCDESDPIVLEFDHIKDKVENVSFLIKSACSWCRVLAEIEKCEVRCCNCHRRKTSRVNGSYRTV
jgi:hypothetical protein